MKGESQTIATGQKQGQAYDDLEQALISLSGELLGFLIHHTGDQEVAADLAQDTLAQALGSLETLRNPLALRGWVFRIALNRFNDELRRRGSAGLSREPLPETRDQGSCRPEHVALARELDAVLRQEVQRLPERQRTVLLLHGLRGLDMRGIGDLLGISPAAVKMSLFHARERMRGRVTRYLGHSPDGKESSQ